MRKRILGPSQVSGRPQTGQGWLDLEQIATIEVTSEDPNFPVESVFNLEIGEDGARLNMVYNRFG